MVKWIWKITKGSSEVWYKLLAAKYLQDGNFFNSKTQGTSQFWQGLHKVKHLFKWGALYTVGDGYKIAFWHDTWLRDCPIRVQFPTLYSMCRDEEALVADYYIHGEWDIDFRKSLESNGSRGAGSFVRVPARCPVGGGPTG